MNPTSSVQRRGNVGVSADIGEIGGVPDDLSTYAISRAQLPPAIEAISLPSVNTQSNSAIAPLTEFLGPALSVDNAAWKGDPIPRMRALQKRLVEHSLALPENDRTDCMKAISVVENAVQMRLRLQQMEMMEELITEDDLKKAIA